MKKLLLILVVMVGFSSIYPIGHGDKMKYFGYDMTSLIAQIPTDQQELPTFIEAKKTFIRLCVRDMRQLLDAYPHDHEIQRFAHACNDIEAILRAVESLEL